MTLACRHIAYSYPGTEHPVLNDFTIQLPETGFHALFGPSGVGKTSIARILAGILDGYTGTVTTPNGFPPLYTYNLERLPGWSGIGRHLKKTTTPESEDRRLHLIECFGLADLTRSRFSQLSLGQKNRINLIRYLLQDFHVLIMDESLANVDESTREAILYEIKALYPDRLFLYISHNIIEVARFCDRIVVLRPPERSPQAVIVDGLDHRRDTPLDRNRLDRIMLEIMNAA